MGECMISIVEYILRQNVKTNNTIKPVFKNSWAQGYKQKIDMMPKSLSGSSKVKPFKPIVPRMKI